MSVYVPRKPDKSGARLSIWMMLFGGAFPFEDSPTVKWKRGKSYRADALIPPSSPGGSGGWQWKTPKKELDPTVAVSGPSGSVYTVVFLSPLNPLVTTGLYDLVSGNLTKAQSGLWMAMQDVPAQVVNPSGKPAGTYYNVPQPLPSAAVSVSPLAGDADATTVFWMKIPPANSCF